MKTILTVRFVFGRRGKGEGEEEKMRKAEKKKGKREGETCCRFVHFARALLTLSGAPRPRSF